jgi:hypothetical protein
MLVTFLPDAPSWQGPGSPRIAGGDAHALLLLLRRQLVATHDGGTAPRGAQHNEAAIGSEASDQELSCAGVSSTPAASRPSVILAIREGNVEGPCAAVTLGSFSQLREFFIDVDVRASQ